jgi:hypothetical protein
MLTINVREPMQRQFGSGAPVADLDDPRGQRHPPEARVVREQFSSITALQRRWIASWTLGPAQPLLALRRRLPASEYHACNRVADQSDGKCGDQRGVPSVSYDGGRHYTRFTEDQGN